MPVAPICASTDVLVFAPPPWSAANATGTRPMGGAVLAPKTALPAGMGHFAQIADSEGNYIGLHQR